MTTLQDCCREKKKKSNLIAVHLQKEGGKKSSLFQEN